MSVASLSGYLNNGGGGSDFTTITIGNTTKVILECDTDDKLLIAGSTAATQPWVDAYFIQTDSEATLTSLETTGDISSTNGTITTSSITIKGITGDGELTVSADGKLLLFNGVQVVLVT